MHKKKKQAATLGLHKKMAPLGAIFLCMSGVFMKLSCSASFRLLAVLGFWGLAGCQMQPVSVEGGGAPPVKAPVTQGASDRTAIDAHMVWGGEVRCFAKGECRFVLVEHEEGRVVLHQLSGRTSRQLDRQPVAYHPDSAVWLSDTLVAAAVEATGSLDIFRVEGERLVRIHQAVVGFAPRDVVLVSASQGQYKMLATPYSGKNVAWIDWHEDNRQAAVSKAVRWCEAPWHPVRVTKIPGTASGGFAVACLDDRKVVAVSDTDLLATPRVLATFGAIARHARPSPSGQWLYVALETGARNARINMQTGELQYIQSPLTGSVAVAPLSDDLVVWADDGKMYLQRLDADAKVLETRWIKTSGFSTGLQLIDVDGDGERDLVVLNSVDSVVDVIYGPVWDRAVERL